VAASYEQYNAHEVQEQLKLLLWLGNLVSIRYTQQKGIVLLQ